MILVLIFIIILILMIVVIYKREIYIEQFEDKDAFSPLEAKLHDTVFNNPDLYKFDIETIAKQVVNDKNYNGLKILDAGCGVGRHYSQLVKTFKGAEITGVDRSSNMLSQARLRNPDGDFIKGDLLNSDLFTENSFDYIFSLLDTVYHNKDNNTVISNYKKWLKPNGILCIHIFDNSKLDPGSQPHTQYYIDDNSNKHGLTYYNGFAHDAYWEHKDDCIEYIQSYITDNGLKSTKVLKMYIPNKPAMIKTIENIGFKLIDVISLSSLQIDDIELFCFKKP